MTFCIPIIFVIILIWSILAPVNQIKPKQQITYKDLFSILKLLALISILSTCKIYSTYKNSTKIYLSKIESDCIHGDTNVVIKDKLMFCKCSKEQVIAPIIKHIGIKEFETKYKKEPHYTLMLDTILDKCAQHLK